ncbi:MAG: GerAB/ArcD/ProY family transporter [Clostridia bacterium]|nr:GerAB/ArcD/ProY family transporter [Clostridia bacterium]
MTNFTPILGNGIDKIFLQGALSLGRYEAFFLFLLLAPSIKDLNKTVTKSFLAATILLLACFFMFFGIFSYPSITEDYSVLYELVRMVSYGRFIQRIESLFLLIWLMVTFLYFSLALSLSVLTMKKLFHIQYHKRIIPSVAIIIIASSLLLSSHTDVINLRKFLMDILCPAIFLWGLLMVIVARIKLRICQKGGDQ